jgi:hypothetical protein
VNRRFHQHISGSHLTHGSRLLALVSVNASSTLSIPNTYNWLACKNRWRNGRVTPIASVADSNNVGWRFDNTYSRLPNVLFLACGNQR